MLISRTESLGVGLGQRPIADFARTGVWIPNFSSQMKEVGEGTWRIHSAGFEASSTQHQAIRGLRLLTALMAGL